MNYNLYAPEAIFAVLICAVLLFDLFIKTRNNTHTFLFAQCSLLVVLYSVWQFGHPLLPQAADMHYSVDYFAMVSKSMLLLLGMFMLSYARYFIEADPQLQRGEYYVLNLITILGLMVMVSAQSLLALYLGLELFSLPVYALIAMQTDRKLPTEAAMKYFVMGALASGMLLYGMSLVYGQTGSLNIVQIAANINALGLNGDLLLSLGLVFIMVGLAFKLGAVPFHMWMPDVYEGAPMSVVMLVGSMAKIGGFGLIVRLLLQGLPSHQVLITQLCMVLAVLSLTLGNVVAIAQTNIKRMLAYSAIAHVGFIFLALIGGGPKAYSAALYYVLVYAIMALAAFAVVIAVGKHAPNDLIDDYKGLHTRNPWLAFIMLLAMFSMMGVPPTVGFYAKLTVLRQVIDAGYWWLAVYAMVFSVIGAFYYLRIVKVMYFDAPADVTKLKMRGGFSTAISINGLAILFLGIVPGFLIAICQASFL